MKIPKRFISIAAATIAFTLSVSAANTKETVAQVTSAVSLSSDVDFYITGEEPFSEEGSVDITNTEHAVIIIEQLRPSEVLAILSHIKINGAAAQNDNNCQVRLHGKGSIIYPYGKEGASAAAFHPLTVFDEQNCQGESCSLFGLENTGGFMTTLTTAKMNNRIRSFTLKRGYMVTFSLKAEGRGYSRCFIADEEDLVMNSLPSLMDQRISSYRVFRWRDPGKIGVADMLSTENLGKLDATWSYTWGNGWDMGTDYECVSHMNHRWGPSASSMGSATYSCHIKTDNEPGNSSDPEPATVDQVLDRWEDLMRTGKRLMTPSSHDGSMNWFRAFLDSIDSRGWRCEILDFHCYWTEGQYNNLKGYADSYGRPIWISEFVWGASWNSNGTFASGVTEAQNKEVMSRILSNLNNWNWIERYAYWNGERDPSRLLKNGTLTATGEYFANMKSKTGYCNYGNYIPKNPPYKVPTDLTVTNTLKKGINTITFNNVSGELTDTLVLTRRIGSNGTWKTLAAWGPSDKEDYEYIDSVSEPGLYSYRIRCIGYDAPRKWLSSDIESVTVGGSYNLGDIMYGRIQVSNEEAVAVSFPTQENTPYAILGMPTRTNTNAAFATQVMTVANDNFKFIYRPWAYGISSNEISRVESSDFIVMQPGNYTWGNMKAEVGTYHKEDATETMMKGEVEVVFNQPFDEGVTPIVIAQNQGSSTTGAVVTTQVYDVTNTGFKVKLQAQEANAVNIRTMYLRYIAITPGQAKLDGYNKVINAGFGNALVGGEANARGQMITFFDANNDTLSLLNPYIIAGPQTHNLDYSCIFRKYSNITKKVTDEDGEQIEYMVGMRVSRQMDPSATYETGANAADVDGDVIGWISISDDTDAENAITPISRQKTFYVRVVGQTILPSDINARIYTTSGTQVAAGCSLPTGIYLVSNGSQTIKVMIR
ncbi:MAG: glycoside hydrolase family protein [Bacteroidaceae bacterium]|nr:glycoside hydrolase family protein [Bacteroidaceae bacterium]